jgi:Calcineurin-like phosphoesterase
MLPRLPGRPGWLSAPFVADDGTMADWSRTVHGVGDLHAGGIRRARVARVLEDVATLPAPALHLQIGDATEHGTNAEDVLARRWLGRLPGRHETILGNHDILHNKRTPAQWARAYGYRAQNFTIHLPFVWIVVVAPDRDLPAERAGTLSGATLAFLERELKAAPGDCWVACHWPLYRTVLGDPRLFTSAMRSFHAKPDDDIRALLARHPNAKAWLSGHTHSPITAPGLITRARLPRGHSILAVNLSALVAVGKTREPNDPLCSLYLMHRPGKIELRFRDHRAGAWTAVGGRRVVSVRV